jgi:hypothetical protein
MNNKKSVLLLLLMLCIGLVPLQNLNAGDMDHMESMLLDCAACDMDKGAAQGACDDAQCMMSTGYCGTQNITSILSRSFRSSVQKHYLVGYRHFATLRYQSHFDFSIYRPPIT